MEGALDSQTVPQDAMLPQSVKVAVQAFGVRRLLFIVEDPAQGDPAQQHPADFTIFDVAKLLRVLVGLAAAFAYVYSVTIERARMAACQVDAEVIVGDALQGGRSCTVKQKTLDAQND